MQDQMTPWTGLMTPLGDDARKGQAQDVWRGVCVSILEADEPHTLTSRPSATGWAALPVRTVHQYVHSGVRQVSLMLPHPVDVLLRVTRRCGDSPIRLRRSFLQHHTCGLCTGEAARACYLLHSCVLHVGQGNPGACDHESSTQRYVLET